MPESEGFWDLYWEMRLSPMENLGKREAILAGSQLIRSLHAQIQRPLRLLELGCGEAQIVGALADAHAACCVSPAVLGVDYNPQSIARCRRDYPAYQFIEGDFTDPALLASLNKADLLLLVNALHEVYSAEYSAELGETDVPAAKKRVEQALAAAVDCLQPGGWLLLFDGLEPPGDPDEILHIHFLDEQARFLFDVFAQEYRPFHIRYTPSPDPMRLSLSRRHFTRYLDKSIFLGKTLWKKERLESYQYFTLDEFLSVFSRLGLSIHTLRTLTVNQEKWSRWVEIEAPQSDFQAEHILILAQKGNTPGPVSG